MMIQALPHTTIGSLVLASTAAWLSCASLQGQAVDPRTAILAEANKVTILPVPKALTFADVIGGARVEEHAFFIQLPSTTALVLATEAKEIDEILFRGQKVEPGRLLRRLPFPVPGRLWIWETQLPQGAVPLIRSQAKLPLMRRDAQFIVLTKAGAQSATLTTAWQFEQSLLPGRRTYDHGAIEVKDRKGFASINVGDPVLHAQTGIVIGAVTSLLIEPEFTGRSPTCSIVFLTFPEPPEKLTKPLTEVWGIPVPSTPNLDEAYVQQIIPLRALGLKIGENIQDAWMRNYHLTRPDGPGTRDVEIDFFGEEWPFREHVVVAKGGKVTKVNYQYLSGFLTPDQMTLMADWLAQKFGNPVQIHGAKGKTGVLGLWEKSPVWIAFLCNLGSEGTLHARMHVASEGEASIKRSFDMSLFTVPVPASSKTFLELVQNCVKESEATPTPAWMSVQVPTPFRNAGAAPKKK